MNLFNLVVCPFCLENIQKGAFVCKHCRRELEPEFLHLYREVLEKNPELGKNTVKNKRELEIQVKHAYLNEIVKMKIEEDERKRIAAENEIFNKKFEKERIARAKHRQQKIDDFFSSKLFKFFIIPILIILSVSLIWFFNSSYWKEYRFIKNGGVNLSLDNYFKKNLNNLDKFNLNTNESFKLIGNNQSLICIVKLKRFELKSICGLSPFIEYTNQRGESIFPIFEIFHCSSDVKRIRSVKISNIWVEDISKSTDQNTRFLVKTSKYDPVNSADFLHDFGCT